MAHTPGCPGESSLGIVREVYGAKSRICLQSPRSLLRFCQYSVSRQRSQLPHYREHLRFRIDVIQKSATILLIKDSRKPPWLLLERLYVLYLHDQHIPRLCTLHLEWTTQVVNPSKVDILHIICAVIVPDLTSSPINTFYFDSLPIFYGSDKRNYKINQRRRTKRLLGCTCCQGATYSAPVSVNGVRS